MEKGKIVWFIAGYLLIAFGAGSSWAEGPRDRIRNKTEQILSIILTPSLQGPEKASERQDLIYDVIKGQFDWNEIGKRTLARHWRKRSEEEKEAFISLFRKLLERTYLDRVQGYSGQKVIYGEEIIDGNFSLVKIEILTDRNEGINVHYKMRFNENDWLIYDLSINGVSLINNYRVQFNNIIMRSSYEGLIEQLKEKVSDEK